MGALVLVPSEDLNVLSTIGGISKNETGARKCFDGLLYVELVAWE
jgi:hypothetical protein